MGFWSFVGSCCSAVGSFVSSAVSAVGRVVTKVAGFAGKVLSTVATVGEKVIKAVKTVWPVVKPWIAKFSNVLNAIPVVGPYLSIAAKTLLALENSPILKKVAQIAENVLPKMKVIGQSLSSWAEIRKAREDAEVLRQAEVEMRNNTERNALCLAQIINKFLIVNSSVVKMIDEDEVTDLESYLRLRADVRILDHVKKHLHEAKGLEDISSDDLFILNFSDKILNNEEVSDVEAGRFEQIINKIYGKSLISLVFNDMVVQWARDLENDRTKEKDLFAQWNSANVACKRFEQLSVDNLLSDEEKAELVNLKKKLPQLDAAHKEVKKAIGHRQDYIEAAEGMLRVYEGDTSLAEVVGDDLDIIKDNVEDVGQVIIDCMNRGKAWEELNDDERGLITDFSNIFRKAAKQRVQGEEEIVVGVAG